MSSPAKKCKDSLRFSIVTPSFNQGSFIEETILSVKNQQYDNFEHLVIDGGSKDSTVDILKRYPHLRWVSEPDKGQTNAGNKGIRMAGGDIIGWLNSDDIYFDDIFLSVESFFQENPGVEVVYGDYVWIDEAGVFIKKVKEIPFVLHRLLFHNFIAHPTVFMKKDIFDTIGFFREDLQFAMDYEFLLRASKKFKIAHLPLFIAKLRFHPNAKTYTHREAQRADYIFITRIHHDLFASAATPKALYPLKKLYFMGLKELIEFRNNPSFYCKKLFFNILSFVSLKRIHPDYRFKMHY